MKKQGFSLIEALVAMVFLAVAILSLLDLNRLSNKMTMDSYYEFMALQLAREPIEIFRGFGYSRLKSLDTSPLPDFPLEETKNLKDLPPKWYPRETGAFHRQISLKHEEWTRPDGKISRAFRVKVTVGPSHESWVKTWLTRQTIVLESLIWEQPL
jgi:hypothetical protein